MLKKKIQEIIFNDDYSDDEIKEYLYIVKEDRVSYADSFRSNWKELYAERIENLLKEIKDYGVAYVFNMPFWEAKPKLTICILNYLLQFSIKYTGENSRISKKIKNIIMDKIK